MSNESKSRPSTVFDAYFAMALVNWEPDPRLWSWEWWRPLGAVACLVVLAVLTLALKASRGHE